MVLTINHVPVDFGDYVHIDNVIKEFDGYVIDNTNLPEISVLVTKDYKGNAEPIEKTLIEYMKKVKKEKTIQSIEEKEPFNPMKIIKLLPVAIGTYIALTSSMMVMGYAIVLTLGYVGIVLFPKNECCGGC